MRLNGAMKNNKLIIASAGSGKTTYLVNRALDITSEQVLITTYTEANEEEIKKAITCLDGYIPANITIQTWFTFLLQHGVRPFQSVLDESIHETEIGFFLTSNKSGQRLDVDGRPILSNGNPIYWAEINFQKFYFTKSYRIYSDKISKFIFECNRVTKGDVINRIARIFDYIFIDEVQDLAGYDLDLLKLLFQSNTNVLLVGDPRQVTYLTHPTSKYKKYSNGNIKRFIEDQVRKKATCEVDETTLMKSHRNCHAICDFSNRLYPNLSASQSCTCCSPGRESTNHQGIFWISKKEIDEFISIFRPTQLRWNKKTHCSTETLVRNFGESKGQTFDRVLIYPTVDMKKWLQDHRHSLTDETKAKLYVAITRARYSVTFVLDENNIEPQNDLIRYKMANS